MQDNVLVHQRRNRFCLTWLVSWFSFGCGRPHGCKPGSPESSAATVMHAAFKARPNATRRSNTSHLFPSGKCTENKYIKQQEPLTCVLTHGCSGKALQSHACPAADLLTRSHELDSCCTSASHLRAHPCTHARTGGGGDNAAGDLTETRLISPSRRQ